MCACAMHRRGIANAETHAAYAWVMQDMSPTRIKGRGAASNPEGRFETTAREAVDDGWEREAESAPHPATSVTEESARSIISRNDSPDIPFAQSINP